METTPVMNPNPLPSKLFVEVTSRCNLQCRMCVKQSPDCEIVDGDMSVETFEALLPALGGVQALILNGIGEPLLHNRLVDFITMARKKMPDTSWIGFQTNGRRLDLDTARRLITAGTNRISVSVDGASPETFRRVRLGAELADADRAIDALSTARTEIGTDNFEFGVEFVVMENNISELPRVVASAADRGADFVIVSHLLPYEEGMLDDVLYPSETDASVAFFDAWRKKAEQQDIDIESYFTRLWKFHKSPEDQRVIAFVTEMIDAADAADTPFHLRQLLAADPQALEVVNNAFSSARRIADDAGMDLTLPAVRPKAERKCQFIEDRSAFVSWNGDVHPCYFLWHSYRCYVDSREKRVTARAFGSLAERPFVDIWNDEEFTAFRSTAGSYEYPFCYNCNVSPCDLITEGEFEVDCYTLTVPCGDCLWCSGLFHCLQ